VPAATACSGGGGGGGSGSSPSIWVSAREQSKAGLHPSVQVGMLACFLYHSQSSCAGYGLLCRCKCPRMHSSATALAGGVGRVLNSPVHAAEAVGLGAMGYNGARMAQPPQRRLYLLSGKHSSMPAFSQAAFYPPGPVRYCITLVLLLPDQALRL
jgi:hypothetical protein